MLNFTAHVESAGEFGRIRQGHLDEDDVVGVRQVVVAADLAKFVAVLGSVAAVGFVGDEPDGPAGSVADEDLRGFIEGDLGDAEFEGRGRTGRPRTQ